MMKKFLFFNLFIGLFSVVSIDAKMGYDYSPYEYQLEAELDLGVVGRKLSFVFEFFDQSSGVINDIFKHQESMHEMIIIPMYERCKGNYKAMIRLIKSSQKEIRRILRNAKKAGDQGAEITKMLNKRKKELVSLLSFMRKNRLLITTLWGSIRAEARYGGLIHSYKSLAKESGHALVQGEKFEKELLYTANKRISRKHRTYPIVYFMRRFLLKDLKRYKRQQDRNLKKLKSGFAVELCENRYRDLTLVKTSIESMDSYNEERRSLTRRRVLMPFKVAFWYTVVSLVSLVVFRVVIP